MHDDATPYKGWANVDLYNDTNVSWSGFQFTFYQVTGGSQLADLYFVSGIIGATDCDPTSSQGVASWIIQNPPGTIPATMDVTFITPIAPNSEGSVKVYTDNTIDQKRFGLSINPVEVPEPITLLFLSLGLVGTALRRKKIIGNS